MGTLSYRPIISLITGNIVAYSSNVDCMRENNSTIDIMGQFHKMKSKKILFTAINPYDILDDNFIIKLLNHNHGDVYETIFEMDAEGLLDNRKLYDKVMKSGLKIALTDFKFEHIYRIISLRNKPQYIKVNKVVTNRIVTDKLKDLIIESIVDFTHEYSIRLIIEDIDSISKRNLLINKGVELVQTNYISVPNNWTKVKEHQVIM